MTCLFFSLPPFLNALSSLFGYPHTLHVLTSAQVRHSAHLFITGPDVVKTVTHEEVTMEELGGAKAHTVKSGVAHLAYDNDMEALMNVRTLFDFLPLSNRDKSTTRLSSDSRNRSESSLNRFTCACCVFAPTAHCHVQYHSPGCKRAI